MPLEQLGENPTCFLLWVTLERKSGEKRISDSSYLSQLPFELFAHLDGRRIRPGDRPARLLLGFKAKRF